MPIKLSIPFLYRRIFSVSGPKFIIVSRSLIVLVTCWFIVFPSRTYFSTVPYKAYAEVALDFVIIAVPIPLIWKLQMDIRKKLEISYIFLLGALTVGASAARTAVQYGVAKEFKKHNPDITCYLSPINYCPIIESALGIFGACLPSLRSIGHVYSLRNMYLISSRTLSKISWSNKSRKDSSMGSERSGVLKEGPFENAARHDNESEKNENRSMVYNNSALNETVNGTIKLGADLTQRSMP